MAIRTLEHARGSQLPADVLRDIALAVFATSPFSQHRPVCHQVTATAVLTRQKPDDVVVVLGWHNPLTALHSVLTDAAGTIVKDAMRGGTLDGDTYTHAGDELEVLNRVRVSNLRSYI